MTEAAFKSHPMWIVFLLGAITVPGGAKDFVPSIDGIVRERGKDRSRKLPLETQRGARLIGPLGQAMKSKSWVISSDRYEKP